jgi:PAS domain S-box-containing protein
VSTRGGGHGDDDGGAERRHYDALVEALADGLVELDIDQRIVAVNQRFLDLTGFERDELIGAVPPHPYWPPDQIEAFRVGTAVAFSTPADEHPLSLVRKDGTAFPVLAWVSPVTGPDGEPVGVIGVLRDLTAQRKVEARYRTLVSQSADLLLVLDGRGHITFVSPSVRDMLGYEPGRPGAELSSIGDVLGYVHADDVDTVRAVAETLVPGGSAAGSVTGPIEVRARHANGSWRVLEVMASELLADPSVEGYVINARDVTERRAMEEALRDSEERFRSTVATLLDGLVIYSAVRDETGRIVDLMTEYANEAVVAHSGVPASAQVGRRLTEVFPLLASEPERLAPYRDVIETGEARRFESPYRQGVTDGLFEVQVTRLGDGCVISFREVSEQRKAASMRAQLERERLLDQLHRAQRLETLGRLAAGVAHDFSNSLAAIRNFTTVVANRLAADDPLRPDVEQILAIAAQAASLTNEVLRFGGRAHDGDVLAPDPLVDEILELVQRSFDSVRLVRGPERTDRVIVASRGQVEQIVVNLLLNACDATDPGGSVTVRVLDLAGGTAAGVGPQVGLEVADTGTGMPPEVVARALEPFFTTKARGRGSGLGLATVHGIVESLGGSLHIDSAPGRGTTVLVLLPAIDRAVGVGPTPGAAGAGAHPA